MTATLASYKVEISGLAPALAGPKLLGSAPWSQIGAGPDLVFQAQMDGPQAADLWVTLQGLVLLGRTLSLRVEPALSRSLVRAAKTRLARRLRDTSPGFSRQGVKLDAQGRYSLTPEDLAMQMARHNRHDKVLDLGCGVGGNSIAFARCGSSVTAIELDADRAQMARHNSRVYGVGAKVQVIAQDAMQRLPETFDGLVFCDPPWGTSHKQASCSLDQFPLAQALWERRKGFAALWLKLPPGFDPNSLRTKASPRPDAAAFSLRMFYGVAPGDARSPKFLLVRYPWPARRLS